MSKLKLVLRLTILYVIIVLGLIACGEKGGVPFYTFDRFP